MRMGPAWWRVLAHPARGARRTPVPFPLVSYPLSGALWLVVTSLLVSNPFTSPIPDGILYALPSLVSHRLSAGPLADVYVSRGAVGTRRRSVDALVSGIFERSDNGDGSS